MDRHGHGILTLVDIDEAEDRLEILRPAGPSGQDLTRAKNDLLNADHVARAHSLQQVRDQQESGPMELLQMLWNVLAGGLPL